MVEDPAKGVDAVRSELGALINQMETGLSAKIDKLERRIDDKFSIVFQTIEAIDRELQPLVLNYTKMGTALNQSIIQNGKVFHEIDVRLAAVEHHVDGLQKQVDGLQHQQDILRKDMNAGFASINEKLDRLLAA